MGRSLLGEAPLAARAVATRLRVAARLRTSSLPELLRGLTVDCTDRAPVEIVERALSTSQRIVQGLGIAPDTCLYRSLTRYALLRRAGHAARFVMALDPSARDVVGHAWVELGGRPVGETLDRPYAVTFSYPPAEKPS